jgi:hypothetical protein
MRLTKTLEVNREGTNCTRLTLNAWRDNEGNDGVLFIAWHEGEQDYIIQTDFVVMDFLHISSFIRDYSSTSAQDYVDSFEI